MNLILPIKGIYFDQIKAGAKTEEYRLAKPYWQKRLEGKTFDKVILTRGYPESGDMARRLEVQWQGFTKRRITHPHFGTEEVEVYAIKVG